MMRQAMRSSIKRGQEPEASSMKGFDDFTLRLGDMIRGERATLGKSLLDVQRELRIRADYISAIENCDASVFDTPSFVAGYVRSYARYLGMDVEEVYKRFCEESGFAGSPNVAADMGAGGTGRRKPSAEEPIAVVAMNDPLAQSKMPFLPAEQGFFAGIKPAAVGSSLVLLLLLGGVGYGGYSVLQEIQQVTIDPVEQAPIVLSELDPIDGAMVQDSESGTKVAGAFTPPSSEGLDRAYRPQALDVPVLTARDAPISTLDPNSVGLYARVSASSLPQVDDTTPQLADKASAQTSAIPGLPGSDLPGVTVIAVRPVWVRVSSFEEERFAGFLNAGDRYSFEAQGEGAQISVGDSGSVYFAVNGELLGPVGQRGNATADIDLRAAALTERFAPISVEADRDLARVVQELTPKPDETVLAALSGEGDGPQVLQQGPAEVTVIAKAKAWVRVRTPSGATLFESIMQPGESYTVPQGEEAPIIRAGNAGAIFFTVSGETYGPYGSPGKVMDNLQLGATNVAEVMAPFDLSNDSGLAKIVADLSEN